jgi:hypothetical protein
MRFSPLHLLPSDKKELLFRLLRGYFWFISGAILGLFFFISFTYIYYKNTYKEVVFPGVYIDNIDFGGKQKSKLMIYQTKNENIQKSTFYLKSDESIATVSAKELNFGYNDELLASQAFSVGKSIQFHSRF